MNKKILFSIIILFFTTYYIFPQDGVKYLPGESKRVYEATPKMIIDTCILRIQYRLNTVQDVKEPYIKTNNIMLLQIGKNLSKYFDFFIYKSDSLSDVYEKQKMDEMEAYNKLIPIQQGTVASNILKNYPISKISTFTYMPMGGFYKYIEDKFVPQWTFESGDSTICGYKCRKSSVKLFGRNYTAWYTEKIPISDGPWKFWGLPGLILKIVDENNEYSFECIGIEKPSWIDNIYINKLDYFSTTKQRFNDGVKKFYENPGVFFESKGVKVDGKTPETIKSLPYNPIELSE